MDTAGLCLTNLMQVRTKYLDHNPILIMFYDCLRPWSVQAEVKFLMRYVRLMKINKVFLCCEVDCKNG